MMGVRVGQRRCSLGVPPEEITAEKVPSRECRHFPVVPGLEIGPRNQVKMRLKGVDPKGHCFRFPGTRCFRRAIDRPYSRFTFNCGPAEIPGYVSGGAS